ncbi:putative hydrolase [Paramyrothecium foliicola]|nr:putative hydrolase [Paramyrothecium foliicola]
MSTFVAMLGLLAVVAASDRLKPANFGLQTTHERPFDVTEFDWSTITPSIDLSFSPCYNETHRCAKLVVPLDWLNETDPARATIAIIARPAAVPISDPRFAGTIITNPGGPGGSGVMFLLSSDGQTLARIPEGDEHKYEFLSFDTRGTGLTEPKADCFRNNIARTEWHLEGRALGSPARGREDVLRTLLARAEGFGKLCERQATDFVSTASVARDMVEIVDKLHELRNREKSVVDGTSELEYGKDDTPRIQFWGLSYGTVLGNYFAAMFPGRVGRMVLEAVEDPIDYTETLWSNNLDDTQKGLEYFWETCYEAKFKCALYKDSDKGPREIEKRFRDFMAELDESPAPHITEQNTIMVITRADVMIIIFRALYFPQTTFPHLASTLAQAIERNLTALYQDVGIRTSLAECPAEQPVEPPFEPYTWGEDAQLSIACGDGTSQRNMTLDEFLEYTDRLTKDSPDFGPAWTLTRLSCTGWQNEAKYRFLGPYTTPPADPSLKKGVPAAPLLFVSSQYDPVTPLARAREAAAKHPGAGLLVQDNVGHLTALVPGKCRDEWLKKYFATGQVPDGETWCEADCRPFQEYTALTSLYHAYREARASVKQSGVLRLRPSPIAGFAVPFRLFDSAIDT